MLPRVERLSGAAAIALIDLRCGLRSGYGSDDGSWLRSCGRGRHCAAPHSPAGLPLGCASPVAFVAVGKGHYCSLVPARAVITWAAHIFGAHIGSSSLGPSSATSSIKQPPGVNCVTDRPSMSGSSQNAEHACTFIANAVPADLDTSSFGWGGVNPAASTQVRPGTLRSCLWGLWPGVGDLSVRGRKYQLRRY